ncbi:hypothetical protein CEUSTIGMA_g8269.t1 [Chlamydomonas eustigma]|uniref:Uncharacterized protein n=1 Tax=Chlamydomonas eustigma TaxID=1157962 RepID=A0A250XCQ1_9CHLO|nr:hypothetical protein CEUSTIGMA_g8269.t1 [Chlamydomonas eustigma]|eukprot:GAX80834.1 hypothetical protein CEUSTIGMA_g8269.t1 [Chlamydomonas eustigma]
MSIQGTLNTATLCTKALLSGKALPYSSGYFAEVVCSISNLRIEGERDAMALKVTSDNKLEAACPQNICPDNHLLDDAAYPLSATSPKDISPVNYLLEEVGCLPTSNPEERPLEGRGRGVHLPSRRASMEVAELSGGRLYYLSRPASKEVTELSGGRLCRLHHPDDSMSEGAIHFLQHLGSVPTVENVDDTEILSAGANIRKAKASKELLVHYNEWLDMQTCKIEQLLLAFLHSPVDGGSSSAGLESEGDGMALNSEQQQPIDQAGLLIVPYDWHSHQDGHESWKSSLHNEITQLCGTATEFLQLRQLQGRLSRQQSKIDQCLSVLCLASQRLTEIDDRILSKQAKLSELVAEVAALQQCDEIMIDNNDNGGGIECYHDESTEQPGGQELHDPMLLQNVDEEEAEVVIPVKEWSIVQNKVTTPFHLNLLF